MSSMRNRQSHLEEAGGGLDRSSGTVNNRVQESRSGRNSLAQTQKEMQVTMKKARIFLVARRVVQRQHRPARKHVNAPRPGYGSAS